MIVEWAEAEAERRVLKMDEGGCSWWNERGDTAVLIQIKETYATFWSETFGRISCKTKDVRDENNQPITDSQSVTPGTEAKVWNLAPSKYGLNKASFEEGRTSIDDSVDYEITEESCRKAASVRLCPRLSRLVMEGEGTVTRTDGNYGFIDSEHFDHRLFVPGFAANSGRIPVAMDRLEATRVHFLSIRNPKPGHRDRFVVALHPVNRVECGNCRNTTQSHWNPVLQRVRRSSPGSYSTPPRLSTPAPTKGSVLHAYQMLRLDSEPTKKELPRPVHPNTSPPVLSLAPIRKSKSSVALGLGSQREKTADDCYLTYIRWTHGYLRSRSLGMIRFERRDLQRTVNIRGMVPGTLASITYIPLPDKHIPHSDPNTPLYKATRILPTKNASWAPEMIRGRARLTTVKKTYGIAQEMGSTRKIFVPGWAGVNNNSEGWQVPQLQSKDIHFLAMPNPKDTFRGEPFAISVHPYGPSCSGPEGNEPSHWVQIRGPASQTDDLDQSRPLQESPATLEIERRNIGGDAKAEQDLLINYDSDSSGSSKIFTQVTMMDTTAEVEDDEEEDPLGIWRALLDGPSPPHPKVSLKGESVAEKKRDIRTALIRATAEFKNETLVDLLRTCPRVFAWAYFGLSDADPSQPQFQEEIATLKRFNLL